MQEIDRAYPPIAAFPKILSKGGEAFMAVIIPGSPSRPHFAAKAYLRVGPETRDCSDDLIDRLVAERSSVVYEVLTYKGKRAIWKYRTPTLGGHVSESIADAFIEDCNVHYITVFMNSGRLSVPLRRIDLTFDHGQNTLVLEVRPS